MNEVSTAVDVVNGLIRPHGGPCFRNWDDRLIVRYLVAHIHHDQAVVIGDAGGRPHGLAVGWRTSAEDLGRPDFAKNPCVWRLPRAGDDCFMIAQVIVAPSGRGWVMPRILAEFQWRYPDWRRLKMHTLRRGRLVRYPNTEKLLYRAEKKL